MLPGHVLPIYVLPGYVTHTQTYTTSHPDDKLPARTFDNFQFVNFTRIMQSTEGQAPLQREVAFALAALMEIPEQFQTIRKLQLLGNATNLCTSFPEPLPLPAAVVRVNGGLGSSSLQLDQRSMQSAVSFDYGGLMHWVRNQYNVITHDVHAQCCRQRVWGRCRPLFLQQRHKHRSSEGWNVDCSSAQSPWCAAQCGGTSVMWSCCQHTGFDGRPSDRGRWQHV